MNRQLVASFLSTIAISGACGWTAWAQDTSGSPEELAPTVVETARPAPVQPPAPRIATAPVPVPAPAPVIDDAAPMVPVDGYGRFAPTTTTSLGLPIELKELPATVSTLSEDFLEATQTNRLRDALVYIPGVTVGDDGGWMTDGILIRGFQSDRFYNDGLKQVNSSIRPHFDTIERIEVLKGAAGAEFGVAEPGGVVNLIRKKPFEGRLYEVDASVGSYGYQHYSLDFNDTLNDDGSLQARLVAAYGESAEWRKGREDNDNIYDYVVAPSVRWDYSDEGRLTFSFERTYQADPQDRGIIYLRNGFPGGFAPRDWSWHQNGDHDINDQNRYRIDWEHDLSDALTVRSTYEYLTYGYRIRGYRNAASEVGYGDPSPYRADGLTWDGSRTIPGYFAIWTGDYQVHNYQFELDYDFEVAGTKNTAVAGFRIFSMESADGYFDPIIGGDTAVNLFNPDPGSLSTRIVGFGPEYLDSNSEEELGYFLRLSTELTPRLRTLVSTQFIDYTSLYYGSNSSNRTVSVRAAASYDLTDIHTIFAGYSNAFLPQSGGTRAGDPIDPTHDQSIEFGLKTELFDGRALWTNSFFHTTRADVTAADPTNVGNENFVINFGEVEVSGFESEFFGQVTDDLAFRGGLAVLDSEIVQTGAGPYVGNVFANAADFQITGFADYKLTRLGLPNVTASAGLVHVSSRPGNSANDLILPSYTVVDAGLRCELNDSTEIYCYASNLLDETYYISMQDGGFGSDQIDVGDRQLFRFGVTKRF